MFQVFQGETADSLWQSVADSFRSGSATEVFGRGGRVAEILHAALCVKNPAQRWVVSRERPMNPAFALAEVIWIVTGRSDAAFLTYFNKSLPEYAGTAPMLHGAYGRRLRSHFGVDQLDRAYRVLKNSPESRQVVLQVWDAGLDLPGENGQPSDPDIPCNVMSMLKIRDGRLEWTQVMRSNDLYLGLPHNLVQFTSLQEIVAGWLGIRAGAFCQLSDSLHVYERDFGHIRVSVPLTVASNVDTLALPKEQSEHIFGLLAAAVKDIQQGLEAPEAALARLEPTLPESYRNILTVLTAESARRTGRKRTADRLMASCTNETFQQLWERWWRGLSRTKKPLHS